MSNEAIVYTGIGRKLHSNKLEFLLKNINVIKKYVSKGHPW